MTDFAELEKMNPGNPCSYKGYRLAWIIISGLSNHFLISITRHLDR